MVEQKSSHRMVTIFDIDKIIDIGAITNELDYDRALIADRRLRLLAKENNHFKKLRSKLRDLIEDYENREWSDLENTDENKIEESENSRQVAELERLFIANRKLKIRRKLKELDLTQENLGSILGHKSKTHMSELMNGIRPFTLKDLIIINRLLKVEINFLIPKFLSQEDKIRVKEAVIKLDKPKIKLSRIDLVSC